jgi:hypothetical protein
MIWPVSSCVCCSARGMYCCFAWFGGGTAIGLTCRLGCRSHPYQSKRLAFPVAAWIRESSVPLGFGGEQPKSDA